MKGGRKKKKKKKRKERGPRNGEALTLTLCFLKVDSVRKDHSGEITFLL